MNPSDRRRLLDLALASAKPGSGSLPHLLRETQADYDGEITVPDLGGITYVIVGGLATARYMPQRMTLDTDILVAAADLPAAEQSLQRDGCVRLGSLTVGGSTWRLPSGRLLDVYALDRDSVSVALKQAVRDNAGRPFITLPYLVIMKLESGQLQDLAVISRMLGFAGDLQLTEVRRLVSRHRPQDAEDLESLIHLGKLESGEGTPQR